MLQCCVRLSVTYTWAEEASRKWPMSDVSNSHMTDDVIIIIISYIRVENQLTKRNIECKRMENKKGTNNCLCTKYA